MNEGPVNQNMVETTDCLEAIGVFRRWKNVFFAIVLICLLLTQAAFWLVDRGVVKRNPETASPASPVLRAYAAPVTQSPAAAPGASATQNPAPAAPVGDVNAAAVASPADANAVTAAPVSDANAAAKSPSERVTEPTAGPSGANVPPVPTPAPGSAPPAPPTSPEARSPADFLSRLDMGHLARTVELINGILIVTIALYVLAMFFSLMVSLVGRMGGIRHISRAFFLSVILLVLAIPWQTLLGTRLPGVVYTFPELLDWMAIKDQSTLNLVVYYLRFSGYWLVFTLLLIMAQIRSARWTKSILRRLEII
jgi:hypothetical protein